MVAGQNGRREWRHGLDPTGAADFAALADMGVAAIFTPGTVVTEAAITVLDRLNEQLGYAQ